MELHDIKQRIRRIMRSNGLPFAVYQDGGWSAGYQFGTQKDGNPEEDTYLFWFDGDIGKGNQIYDLLVDAGLSYYVKGFTRGDGFIKLVNLETTHAIHFTHPAYTNVNESNTSVEGVE